MNVARGLRRGLLIAATAWLVGCSPDAEAPETATVDGESAYTVRCSYCHDVPNGIGAAVTPSVLAAYSTVGQLDRYLRVAMPHEAPGSLPDSEYDAILRYLIESRGVVSGGTDAWPLPDSTRLRSS
ncbi:MAG: cytochrome c [Gemmatimonadota bacterium]|nr:cytochrome c [Gemmatimonadota bacterium]